MKIIIFVLRVLNKLYSLVYIKKTNGFIMPSDFNISDDEASEMIFSLLTDNKPCMIARYGSFELNTCLMVESYQRRNHSYIKYIKGEECGWWWDERLAKLMENNAGFFPATKEMLAVYKDRMFEDTKYLDLLGDFAGGVRYIEDRLTGVLRIHLKNLEPFYGKRAWTTALKGKRVLVVHPLAKLIEQQYAKHRLTLFENQDILPEFHLETIQAVQSLGGVNEKFSNWFDALKWMEDEIDKHEYDICLIGCGAYGFCLAAHCKRMGKKGFHVGGVLQFIFGITGGRWDDPYYNTKEWNIPERFYLDMTKRPGWTRPSMTDRPMNADTVENSCYW